MSLILAELLPICGPKTFCTVPRWWPSVENLLTPDAVVKQYLDTGTPSGPQTGSSGPRPRARSAHPCRRARS